MHNIFYILLISYIVGANIAAITLIIIQKREYNRVKVKFISENNLEEESFKIEESLTLKENKAEDAKENSEDEKPENEECQEKCEPIIMSEREQIRKYAKIRLAKEQQRQLLAFQRKKCLPDAVLLIVSAAGGAIGLYASMFIHRFKLKSLVFMLVIPVLCGLNIFLLFQFFTVWWVVT